MPPNPPEDLSRSIETLYRSESGRILATLVRLLGDLDLAQEVDEFLYGEIFYLMKEIRILAERWRVHYNTIRPRSSLGYRSPAPESWQTEIKTGCGEVESKLRFPLPHTLDADSLVSKEAALH